jgi:hypothetical protein
MENRPLVDQPCELLELIFVRARGAIRPIGLDADMIGAGVEMALDMRGDLLGFAPADECVDESV